MVFIYFGTVINLKNDIKNIGRRKVEKYSIKSTINNYQLLGLATAEPLEQIAYRSFEGLGLIRIMLEVPRTKTRD